MSISCIKTVTGEDLIGEVIVREEEVDIADPCVVVVVPTSQSQYSVGLAPFLPFANSKKFSFRKEHVIMFYDPADGLRNEYNRITGKGIVVPTNKIELMK